MTLDEWVLTTSLILPLVMTALLGLGALLHISEKIQIKILIAGMLFGLISVGLAGLLFAKGGFEPIHTPELLVFARGDYKFSLSLYLDSLSMAFLTVTLFFGNLVAFFSRRYLHLENGMRRFSLIISFFIFGMVLAILSSNLDTLFAGWEIVGISSYLLIAYYWEREKPVRNAERVYWVYRICDLGLLLGAFFAHTVWKETALFCEIGSAHHLEALVRSLPLISQLFLGGLIALAAFGKSAQFPFLTWLPRALEGPTPSTAIFYGALSIHLGVYLLMRMEPIWRLIPGFAVFLGGMGLLSAFMASSFGRLQTTIKGQIAYASSTQVGVMFFEVALGLEKLAIIHFIANALFRGYQLLSAPSILSERLHLQSSSGGVIYRSRWLPEILLPRSFSESLYLFSLNEGYLDAAFLKIGQALLKGLEPLHRLLLPSTNTTRARLKKLLPRLLFLSLGILGLSPGSYSAPIAYVFVAGSFLFSYMAFEESDPFSVLVLILVSQCLPILATSLLNPSLMTELSLCLLTVLAGGGFAYFALNHISKSRDLKDTSRFQGLFQSYPRTAALFFVASASIAGFPITFTFVVEDLIFHHLVPHSGLCALIVCITYVLNGASLIRLFSAVFLGPEDRASSIKNLGLSPKLTLTCFVLLLGIQWLPFMIGGTKF